MWGTIVLIAYQPDGSNWKKVTKPTGFTNYSSSDEPEKEEMEEKWRSKLVVSFYESSRTAQCVILISGLKCNQKENYGPHKPVSFASSLELLGVVLVT